MSHCRSNRLPVTPSSLPVKRCRRNKKAALTLDSFVSHVYLPYARRSKRSWEVDERITRRHISATFGAARLGSIKRRDVESWLQKLSQRGLAPATCNRILAVLKNIFSLAQLHGALRHSSPCSGVAAFKEQIQRERYLARAEAQRLMLTLKHSPRPEAKALRLLLLTGARKSEVLKARWENVHIDQRLLIVPLSKSGKPRYIPLSDEAIGIINSLQRTPDCPWLFPGHAPGKPLSDIYLFWNELRHKLGLENVRIHDLRHSFASFLVNSGHSLYEVQKLLGHSDPRTTMRYAHMEQDSLVAAAQTVSACIIRDNSRQLSQEREVPSSTQQKTFLPQQPSLHQPVREILQTKNRRGKK